MVCRVEFTETALRALRKLDKRSATQIIDYMEQRIARAENPRTFGKALKGPLGELWRYRVGDYRILCTFDDGALRVLVVDVGHRRDVYR